MEVSARRKWLRCSARLPISVKVLDEKNRRVWRGRGTTINLGGLGALIEVPGLSEELIENLIKEKYKLQLALELPNIFWRIGIRAKVVWVEELKRIPGKLGVAFENLSEEKETRLVDFVEERLSGEIVNHAFKRKLEKWFRGEEKK